MKYAYITLLANTNILDDGKLIQCDNHYKYEGLYKLIYGVSINFPAVLFLLIF